MYLPSTQEILNLLPIVSDRGWKILENEALRDRDDRCPLCALAHEISDGEIDYEESGYAAMVLLFDYCDDFKSFPICTPIFDAADDSSHPLRPRLLQILGV